jgi:hypothetical protein
MDVRRRIRSLAATALAATMLLVAASAFAQPKPALVQDRDEPGRNFFQERVQRDDCGGETNCLLLFPAVPANMRLVITQISVLASLSDADARLFVRVGNVAQPNVLNFVLPGPGNARMTVMPLTLYLTAGQQPRVEMSSLEFAFASVATTLSGYWVAISP